MMFSIKVLATLLALAPADSLDCQRLHLDDARPLQVAMKLTELGVTSWGCESRGVVRATWSRPTTGEPVVMYLIEIEANGAWPDTTVLIPVPTWAGAIRSRVCGVDARGRAGQWGLFGPWYEPGGTP